MSEQPGADPTSITSSENDSPRKITRYITSHDSSGKSILIPDTELFSRQKGGGIVSRAYAVTSVPVQLSNDQDLNAYLSKDDKKHDTSHLLAGRQTTVPKGVNMTYLELAPGAETAMHRTVSLDFTVVLEGELEMELDSGDKVILKPGDSVVQRATMHKWKNASQKNIVRVIGVLCACERIAVDGKLVEEEWLEG